VCSWAYCALELLALEPIGAGRVFLTDIVDVVRASSNKFADPKLAVHLATAAVASASMERLTRLVDAICEGLGVRPDKWLAILETG